MTQEEKAQLNELMQFMKALKTSASIPYDVDSAFRTRLKDLGADVPDELANAPLTSITSPTGGTTVDSQARSVIDTIITRLEYLGLVLPN